MSVCPKCGERGYTDGGANVVEHCACAYREHLEAPPDLNGPQLRSEAALRWTLTAQADDEHAHRVAILARDVQHLVTGYVALRRQRDLWRTAYAGTSEAQAPANLQSDPGEVSHMIPELDRAPALRDILIDTVAWFDSQVDERLHPDFVRRARSLLD